MSNWIPRPFRVIRDEDVTGVSGAGHVADGVTFSDGTTVLRWLTEHRSTAIYASYEDMERIHGHNGATRFEFTMSPADRDALMARARVAGEAVQELAGTISEAFMGMNTVLEASRQGLRRNLQSALRDSADTAGKTDDEQLVAKLGTFQEELLKQLNSLAKKRA